MKLVVDQKRAKAATNFAVIPSASTCPSQPVRPGLTRISVALIVLVVLAFPFRIWKTFGLFSSFSPTDVVLLVAVIPLMLSTVAGRLNVGPKAVALALSVPIVFCLVSFAWAVDANATTKAALKYSEAMVAYLLAIAIYSRLSANMIAKGLGLLVLLLIVTAFSSAAGLPWLEHQIPPNLYPGTSEYEDYLRSLHARLSHPYLGLSNNFAGILAFFPILLASYGEQSRQRVFSYLGIACVIAIALTFSRGVIGALVLGYSLYILRSGKFGSSLIKGLVVVGLIAGGILVYIQVSPEVAERLVGRTSLQNFIGRLEIWQVALDAVADSPIYGYGAGTAISYGGVAVKSVHNAFLSQVFYFGWFGGLVVALSILMLPMLVSKVHVHSVAGKSMRRALAFSLLTQIIIFLSQTSFEGSQLRVFFYFSTGLSIALIHAIDRENKEQATLK